MLMLPLADNGLLDTCHRMAGAGLLSVRGRFGPLLPRILRVRNSRGQGVEVLGAAHGHLQGARPYSQLTDNSRQLALARPLLQRHQEHGWQYGGGSRGLGWVPAFLSRLLKVRYLVLGGAVGGGGALARQGGGLVLYVCFNYFGGLLG